MRKNTVAAWIVNNRGPLLFIAIAVLIAIHLPASVNGCLPSLIQEKSVWGLPEDAVCLFPDRSAQIKGYEVDGHHLKPTDSDPQMGYALEGETVKALLIDLETPAERDTEVEVYWGAEEGDLSEDNRSQYTIRIGEDQLLADMPSENNGYIRVDINGEVTLKGIYCTSSAFVENKVQLPLRKSRVILVYAVCILFFIALMTSAALVLLRRRGSPGKVPFIVTAVARVWLGCMAGVWYPPKQGYDDALIFHYSDLASYLSGRELPSRNVMLKELGMPIILNIVNFTGISYTMFLSLLWVLSGALGVLFVRRMSRERRPRAEFLTFVFILFQPVALENWTGTRLYRNALLTPMYFLTFLLALIILYDLVDGSAPKLREALCCSLPLGIVFSLAYLIKEDGVWLMLSIGALAVIMLCACVYRLIRRQLSGLGIVKAAVAICVPFVILFMSITAVKQVNYNAFGVHATNARTAGEEGKFVTYVYKTASDDRSLDIWAPVDAIEKVFKASKTLRKNKALKKTVLKTPWCGGNMRENPVKGDFLTWVIKDALFDSGTCTTKREAEAYMKKVNRELEAAFKKGKLEVDPKFRLTGSMGGISRDEAVALLSNTVLDFKNMIFMVNCSPGGTRQINDTDDTEYASVLTNQDLNTIETDKAIKYRKYECAIANSIILVFFKVYGFVQPVLLALSFIALAIAICHIIRTILKRNVNLLDFTGSLMVLFFISLTFAYLFMISWFTYFLHNEYFSYFYSVGALPLITLFEITGLSLIGSRRGILLRVFAARSNDGMPAGETDGGC